LGNLLLSNGKSSIIGLLNNGKCGRNCIGGIVREKSCAGAENRGKTTQNSMHRLAARGWPPGAIWEMWGVIWFTKNAVFRTFPATGTARR